MSTSYHVHVIPCPRHTMSTLYHVHVISCPRHIMSTPCHVHVASTPAPWPGVFIVVYHSPQAWWSVLSFHLSAFRRHGGYFSFHLSAFRRHGGYFHFTSLLSAGMVVTSLLSADMVVIFHFTSLLSAGMMYHSVACSHFRPHTCLLFLTSQMFHIKLSSTVTHNPYSRATYPIILLCHIPHTLILSYSPSSI